MVESKELTIKNKLGLHARAAAMLVKTTNSFQSEVYIEKDGQKVNGKSIMGVMMLAAAKGSTIKVEVSGPDAAALLARIEDLVDDLFGEGE
ncbi:MAG: HPr family phosphocarrier protein [Deltaproteobacteria bacterium]|nr:HPr family phosphocarrier protein [Deltaproteobacteria bacterium]